MQVFLIVFIFINYARLRYAFVREKEEANATGMSGSAEILSGFSVYVEAPENLRGGEILCVIVYSVRVKTVKVAGSLLICGSRYFLGKLFKQCSKGSASV